jgi:hypothetical protein
MPRVNDSLNIVDDAKIRCMVRHLNGNTYREPQALGLCYRHDVTLQFHHFHADGATCAAELVKR